LAFQEKLAANPEIFGKVKVAQVNPPNELTLAPDNSVDIVVTFRNIHNWVKAGIASAGLRGALQSTQARGHPGSGRTPRPWGISLQESIKTGYMSEDGVIAAVEKAGFKLVGFLRD
jgi:predicted methyltransferase